MDKISVIIPVYNSSEYLYDCLHSIFKSTYRNLEVIVVDDGSKEDVLEAAADYKDAITFIATKHKGQSSARNLGFKKSTGEYVSFIDVDDINGKMRYELCIKKFEENPKTGMVFCSTTFINENGEFLTGVSKFPRYSRKTFLGRMYEINWIGSISATIMRSSVFEKVKGFDETFALAEDYDLYLRIAKQTIVDYIDLPLVRKRYHENSMGRDLEKTRKFEKKALKKYEPAEIASQLSRVYDKEEDFRIGLGRVLFKIGMTRQALPHFQKALEINELNEDIYYFTGNCYFKIGKHQKADEEYGKCLALNPQHVACLNNLGVLHFHTGESDRSISELKKAAKYSTNSFEPKYNLACIKDDRPRENLRLSFLGERQLIAEGAMQF